jgi:hypothetical protein
MAGTPMMGKFIIEVLWGMHSNRRTEREFKDVREGRI